MSSTAKNILYSMTLLLLFPMSAFADIKIIIGQPAYSYKHNYSNSYSNNSYYKKNKIKYNKYNYPPYSYRSDNYNLTYGHNKRHVPSYQYPPKINYNRNYNPYSSFRYIQQQNTYQNAYQRGFRDGLHKKKRRFKH